MAQKSIVLVFLAFFTTLFLVTGVSLIFATTKFDYCTEEFCYAIKDFILFYQTIFFSYGALLSVISAFGFIAMFLENKTMLGVFGKLLIFQLILTFIIIWLGLWAKGPMYLRSTLFNTFKSYGSGECRLDMAVDCLQSKFRCCGVEHPDDWESIRIAQKTASTLEPPLSCCSPSLFFKKYDSLKCITTYQNGCYVPVRRFIWRIMSVITVIGFGFALKMTLAIICVFQYIRLINIDTFISHTQQNFEDNMASVFTNQAMPLNLYQDGSEVKNTPSSTVV